ncbi:MAG TPA: glycosyltransferase family 4 protein [Solirubrobacterales bacterium]|nr:glycosyltransferase family 4 protein [Solirubrobacterales bacterium]
MAEAATPDVTIVANDIGPEGGMERQLRELIGGLLEGGHRVTVIAWTCSLPTHRNLRWIRVPGPSRPFALGYPLFLFFATLLIRLRGRGVVHSTGAIVLNHTDVCTVHFCHRAFADLPAFSRASRSGLAYRLNAALTRLMSRLAERWCYRAGRTTRLVGVSQGVARELFRHFPRMRKRTVVIPNGVDTDAFRPPDEQRQTVVGRLEALFVGGEWERKGLRFAIEALEGLDDVELTVVGEGDRDAHQRLAERLGVADRVTFAGPTDDVLAWYRRADAFLLPTAYETFSLVTYEAAACGLPLLVTRVNGVEDLLQDGRNGWFVERDAAPIRERLRTLRDDPALRLRMGQAAREDSLDHDWAQVVAAYRAIYAEAASRSATNSPT